MLLLITLQTNQQPPQNSTSSQISQINQVNQESQIGQVINQVNSAVIQSNQIVQHGMENVNHEERQDGHLTAKTELNSRNKPQACKICGKILSSASSYYVHMKLHSGNKPFQCTVSTIIFVTVIFHIIHKFCMNFEGL